MIPALNIGAMNQMSNINHMFSSISDNFLNRLRTIERNASSGCSWFTGLTFDTPRSITSIGSYAFSEYSDFTGNLLIPNSVTSIDSNAVFTNTISTDNDLTRSTQSNNQNIDYYQDNFVNVPLYDANQIDTNLPEQVAPETKKIAPESRKINIV